MFSGADAARSSRRKFHHRCIGTFWKRYNIKKVIRLKRAGSSPCNIVTFLTFTPQQNLLDTCDPDFSGSLERTSDDQLGDPGRSPVKLTGLAALWESLPGPDSH